jgi:D-arginine dehydrogenase
VRVDFLVLGAGMAGAAAAYFLAEQGSTIILEREDAPGYHATGRSAALYTETYGNAAIRALTVASGRFFRAPPPGFAATPLLKPRGVMMVAPPAERARFEHELAEGRAFVPNLRVLTPEEALRLCPVLRRDWLGHAFLEPDAMDMDVHAIHQGFLRGFRARGGRLVPSAAPRAVTRQAGRWRVATETEAFEARFLVDAAGAWADEVAALAGVPPVGLVPKRRTAFIVAPPPGLAVEAWPLVGDIAESFYFKPESGRLLASPADETPVPPQDVQPEELDIALAAERIGQATTLAFRHIERKWAGLRTFAPDKTPVIGPDPAAPGFLWMAGQGGYGIQTAPAAGAALAALVATATLPAELAALGLTREQLLPDRLR